MHQPGSSVHFKLLPTGFPHGFCRDVPISVTSKRSETDSVSWRYCTLLRRPYGDYQAQ